MKTALVGMGIVASAAIAMAQGDRQVFRTGVETVFVDVSVLKGRTPVNGLTTASFTLTDNGVRQDIESVAGTAIPLDLSLVIDASWWSIGPAGSGAKGPGRADILRRDAKQIVRLLRPEDRLGVITFAAEVVETRAMSLVGADSPDISLENPTSWSYIRRPRVTQALLTALTAEVPSSRRHLVVGFSSAQDADDVPPGDYLGQVCARADALLYMVLGPQRQFIDTHEPSPFFPAEDQLRHTLIAAAEATGGKAYLTGDIVGAFRDILTRFRSSYVLRYTVRDVPTAGWHEIVVKVPSCLTCTIHARRGYMGR